ncbi:GTP cyclohydrolase II RibA [Prosthecomicrobium sp. N25]|uniref:GTP cyclohydrolase II RibA n=1 Tax=Prosthecomicrobium sp. N25 TaxID=3129254 RepID=UPI0030770F3B
MSDIEALVGTPRRLQVERATVEFRSGRPCLLVDGASVVLAAPVDSLDEGRLGVVRSFAEGGAPRLLLTGRRAHWLGLIDEEPAVVAVKADRDARGLLDLVLGDRERVEAGVRPAIEAADAAGHAAVELARLARLAPSALVLPLSPAKAESLRPFLACVPVDAVMAYRREVPADLQMVSQARVPLKPGIPTRFVVFRGAGSLHDQVAIVIGSPDTAAPVPVRLHSACITGDLFGSLKCDCGDQLRNTVERFQAMGGGVLLYLDQEGRGIGIANKMRAYRLQETGFDTIDADAQLGFADDERSYEEAARMLQLLGYTRVLLHSNNPRKGEALRRAGLEVVAREPVLTPVTRENARYLKTKAERAGHLIDSAWVDEVEAALTAAARSTAAE